MKLLTIKNLNISDKEGQAIIKNVDLNIYNQSLNVIIGESGAGKSLTVKAILNHLPTQLHMSFDEFKMQGQNTSGIKQLLGKHIGYISQNYAQSFNEYTRLDKQLIAIYRYHFNVSKDNALKKIKKAIIPAAGLGTRFLPATKAMPKEMLPILDKPTIQYIVEEASKAGIEDIIIVTGKHKRAIEDHFDNQKELEMVLENKGKADLLEKVQYSTDLANIFYVRQKEQKGLGHAIHTAKQFIGNEPFAVLLGDDIVESDTPAIKQLMDVYEETGHSVIGVQEVPESDTHRYGVIDPSAKEGSRYEVRQFVEKPKQGTAPSNLAIMGRYVLTPEIFDYLETQQEGAGNEIQLTDAIERMNSKQQVYAYDFEGNRYDVGEKLGFVKTTIEYALKDPEMSQDLKAFIKQLDI